MISPRNKLYLYILSGGAIGVGLRYGLLLLTSDVITRAPWVIFTENITGSFLLGILTGYVISKKIKEWPLLPFAGTGILGSFTTFSTFALDIIYFINDDILIALFYSFSSIVFGLIAAFLGIKLGKGAHHD